MVWHKYITPMSLIDWIRNPVWRVGGISGIWKVVLDSLDIICGGLVWKIGNGNAFRLGMDLWPRSR